MGMIESTIRLRNQMTPVLENIISSMNTVISASYRMEDATGKSMNVTALNTAKEMLADAEVGLRKAAEAQDDWNNEVKNTKREMNNLTGMIKRAVGAYVGFRSVKGFAGLSDVMAQIQARLNGIKDEGRELADLQETIYQSAQRSRGEYKTTLDIVSKLGAQAKMTFRANQETIAFAENLNKLFAISGTEGQGMESVMYNLTQAMATGVLRGQDLNAVMSNTPQILEIVADYMGVGMDQIRALAEEGQLSAEVVKNALIGASEDINQQFEQMPMTFEQIGMNMKNRFIHAIEPALQRLNDFANSEDFAVFAERAEVAIEHISMGIATATEYAIQFATFVANHWSTIEPIIWGLASAYTAWSVATTVLTIKQEGLNLAFLSSPIFWILTAVGVAIGLYLRWAKSVGGVGIAHQIALNQVNIALDRFQVFLTNVVYGALNTLNNFETGAKKVWNGVVNGADWMRVRVATILQNMVNDAIDKINVLLSLVDMIPGIETTQVERANFADNMALEAEKAKGTRAAELKKMEEENKSKALEREQQLEKLRKDQARERELREQKIRDAQAKVNKTKDKQEKLDLLAKVDIPSYGELPDIGKDLKEGKKAAKGTKKNTDKLKDGITVKNEDIAYLKDLAEMRAIQNFSFEKLEVVANNSFGDIHETADLDGWMDNLTDQLSEAVNMTMGGVPAYE